MATVQTSNSLGQHRSSFSVRLQMVCILLMSSVCSSVVVAQEEYPNPIQLQAAESDKALEEVAGVLGELDIERVDSIIVIPEQEERVFLFQAGSITTKDYEVDAEVLLAPRAMGDPPQADWINNFKKILMVYWSTPKTKVECEPHEESRRKCQQTN